MKTEINSEKVLNFEALALTKKVFSQIRTLDDKEIDTEGIKINRATKWIGYVLDINGITEWYITEYKGTLVKIKEVTLFWRIRTKEDPQPIAAFRASLPQIFVK